MNSLTALFRPLMVAALCAGTTAALAQTHPQSQPQPPTRTSEAISLTQAAPAALRVRITTPTALAGRVQVVRLSTGQTLFAEQYSVPEYGHRFDFSRVPSGRYLVWLRAGDTVHRCLVRVQTQAQGSTIRIAKLTSRGLPASVAVSNRPTGPQVAGL